LGQSVSTVQALSHTPGVPPMHVSETPQGDL
jgi:hypothetical protein